MVLLCLFLPVSSIANDAILTWISELEDGVYQVNVQRMINNEWQPVEAVYSSKELNYSPTIGSNKLGDIMVVWTSRSTVRSIGRAILFHEGKWQKNEVIANQGGQVTTPAIVFDQSNNAHIVWVSDHNGLDDVFYQTWIAKRNEWTKPELVNQSNKVPDILPNVSLDLTGDVLVQWQSISLETNNYAQLSRVFETTKPASGESNNDDLRQLSFSDITMPKDWKGSIGSAVIHFPNNYLLRQEKLPQYISNP